jgi:alkylated DNA nucleotide flippase Atl1
MRGNLICANFSQHHNTTTMTGIEEALAECDSIPSGDKTPWQRIADKHGVVRSTLTRRHRRETRSREEVSTSQQNLQPQQEAELVKYIEGLTERKLPPTREMVQNYASDIAGHPVSESWVARFLHRHQDELTSQWSTSMDRKRHAADSSDKYNV